MTREEKIKMFDRNQEIALLEEQIFVGDNGTDLKRTKNIFMNLLNKYDKIEVIDKPIFSYDERNIQLVTRLAKTEQEIVDYFSRYDKIFIYTITEILHPDNLSSKFLVVRYATI